MRRSNKIQFKLAGGAAAQTLGLINALHIKNKFKAEIEFKYFPYSTGTYWPFAIGFLLYSNELLESRAVTRGLDTTIEYEVGKIIRNHPLEKKSLSYEHLLKFIRRLKIEYPLKKLRNEMALEAKLQRLENVKRSVKYVSGGFVPILDKEVMKELDSRFRSSRDEYSPFGKTTLRKDYIAIHYRIGDKRAKFTHDKDFGGDGIFHPLCFKELLDSMNSALKDEIYVVSDEPEVAKSLLHEVGIEAKLFPTTGDIWRDLHYLSQASILVGSWSQVSQLAAICVANNGGESLLPSQTQVGTRVTWNLPFTSFFTPRYLDENHAIYQPDFRLGEDAHVAYRKSG